MAITPEASNTTENKKNYWECEKCSIKHDKSLTRCGSCGELRHRFPASDSLVGNAVVTVEEKYEQPVSSIRDQEGDAYKSSEPIARSNFSSIIFINHFTVLC